MDSQWVDRPRTVRDGEEQFPRGFSNLTYLLRMGSRELVLRRPPIGAAIRSAHDMGREHRILSRLAEVYDKAPTPLLFCEDPAVLGAPFYVMERVEGVILRPRMPAAMHPDPTRMAAIAGGFIETLAELHAVDFAAAGLSDLGRPEGYVRRQIEGWTGRYDKSRTDDIPEMIRVAAWLDAQAPLESAAALIHNDFKYDNLVLDPDSGTRVIAVLDWEMATIGDPLMDLGTSLGYWVDPEDPPELRQLALSPTLLLGNPSRSELVERYIVSSGRQVDDPVFYYVYGLFKIAVIVQQIYARYRQGHTRDPRFARLIEGVRVCSRVASRAAELSRIDRLF
jgi:aminoglycoside phosphotransferase (APT) family kinase protein